MKTSGPIVLGQCELYHGDARMVDWGRRVDVVVTDPVWPNCPDGLLPGSDGTQGSLTRTVLDRLMPFRTLVMVLGYRSDPRWLAEAVPTGLPFIRTQTMPYGFPGYHGRLLCGDEVAYIFGAIPKGRGVIPGRGPVEAIPKSERAIAHPCSRSKLHTKWLVNQWSQVGDVICDPFMGSGTTGVAAAELGCQFLGCEIHSAYFQVACERIRTAQRQGMFAFLPATDDATP